MGSTETLNGTNGTATKQTLIEQLHHLYSDDVVLKIWKTATEHLARETFPETVPQSGEGVNKYTYRPKEFWTCGFFPGNVYCLLERSVRHPGHFLEGGSTERVSVEARQALRDNLLEVARGWSEPIHKMAYRTNTHDMGFIVIPALRRDYELTGSERSRQSILTAAESLATRYNANAKAIRSWDKFMNNRHHFASKEDGFLVIIDSMCNLDLLYYAGHHFSNPHLIDIATIHAHTVIKTHMRKEASDGFKYQLYSTCHVANLDAATGDVLQRVSAQGYADPSTWARGQAWAILGYAQTYTWTKDPVFLYTACGLAQYFVNRLEAAPACVEETLPDGRTAGRYVPLWDFDAPIDEASPLRDTSAGTAAANGMLILHGALTAVGDVDEAQKFLQYAVKIVKDTLDLCYAPGQLKLVPGPAAAEGRAAPPVAEWAAGEPFDAILTRATANFNASWPTQTFNHGLVYGDFYLLEFGNRLLKMDLC